MTDITNLTLTFRRGDTWRKNFTVTKSGVNFAGTTALMQVRASAESPDVLASFTISNIGTSTVGTMTFTATVAAATTAAIAPGQYVYDIQLTYSDTTVQTVAGGAVNVIADVSR